jgi:hypothetical protein
MVYNLDYDALIGQQRRSAAKGSGTHTTVSHGQSQGMQTGFFTTIVITC